MKNNNILLTLKDVYAAYYKREILKGISLSVRKGKITAIIGPNGSGKSTLLKTIFGILHPLSGRIEYKGEDITGISPVEAVRKGMGYFIQGGEIFSGMSVYENLYISGISMGKERVKDGIERAFDLFPALKKLRGRRAGLLSGGERQALAFSMVLVSSPELLLLDEPSAGLSPVLVRKVMGIIKHINSTMKTSIILVEQNIREALAIADTVYVLKNGEILGEESPHNLLDGKKIHDLFFS